MFSQTVHSKTASLDIANVKYDLIRNLKYSPMVRNKLIELNPAWAGFSKTDIETMSKQAVFSLP